MIAGRRVASGDLVAGVLTAGLGLSVLLYVRRFPELSGGQPGPALFPGIIGALMVLFGLVLAVRAVLALRAPARHAAAAAETDEAVPQPGRRSAVLRAVAVLAAVGFYLLVADHLGFIPTMAALLWLLMVVLGASVLRGLGAAVLATVVVYYLFRVVLLVPLPLGPLG